MERAAWERESHDYGGEDYFEDYYSESWWQLIDVDLQCNGEGERE